MVEDKDITKTGTTTVGIVCKDGIVLAADKRVTSGYLVSYKEFEKIIILNKDIAVTVAGTVSDVQLLSKYIKAELNLKQIRTGRDVTVKEAVNLLGMLVYNNIRKMSMIPGISHFIMAGRDDSGYHCYDLGADGSIIKHDKFVSSGSGSVLAYGVLETVYKEDMTVEEGIKVAVKAINAAVQRDIASGNGVNVVTVTSDGVKNVLSKNNDMSLKL
jgi:proteasome beta subunit